MQTLVRDIESVLQTKEYYFVRPDELKRVWSGLDDERREETVRDFARDHGWRIFTYSRVLGAMFVRES